MVAVRPQASYRRFVPARAALVVVPATSRVRRDPAVYRRRRLLAGGVLLLVLAAALLVVQLALAGTGGGPLAATGAAASQRMAPIGSAVWVVQPGDTLWSIAARLDPHGDERPLVDRLAAELGGADIHPGEAIPLPTGPGR